MNNVILIGRLTKAPEVNTTTSGTSVARMTIAVDRRYKDASGNKLTDFIPVVAWRTLADNCGKYLDKGKQVAVVGNLQLRSYEDNDGNKRTIAEVIAENIEFLSPASERRQETIDDLPPVDDDEDLPF